MSLVSAVYVSTATKPLGQFELVHLLRVSRDNNARHGLTGMLLYHDGNFMQVLEGEKATVNSMINKLQRDGRHRGLLVLLQQTVDRPTFGEWQMAFRNTTDLANAELSEVSQFLQPAFASGDEVRQCSAAMKLLRIFRAGLR